MRDQEKLCVCVCVFVYEECLDYIKMITKNVSLFLIKLPKICLTFENILVRNNNNNLILAPQLVVILKCIRQLIKGLTFV